MAVVCPVCLATVTDVQARFCTDCGQPLAPQLSADATIPDLKRSDVLAALTSQPQSLPLPRPPASGDAVFFEPPQTLPPWFRDGNQAPDTVPGIDARTIVDGIQVTAPVAGQSPPETISAIESPASQPATTADLPTVPVDRYQGPLPSYLAETIGPPLQEEQPEDPWAVDDPRTTAQRPPAKVASASPARPPAATLAPVSQAALVETSQVIFAPLAAAPVAVPEPAPPAEPLIELERAGAIAGAPAGQFVLNASVVPNTAFAASTMPFDEPGHVTDPGMLLLATELALYSPRAAPNPEQPAAQPNPRRGHRDGAAAGAPSAAVACWQCGILIAATATYYRVASRPWCAVCAAPYLTRSTRQRALLLAKLVLFVGAIATTFFMLWAFRLVASFCVGLVLFWLLFARTRRRVEIKRIDPPGSLE